MMLPTDQTIIRRAKAINRVTDITDTQNEPALDDAAFKNELSSLIPQLRAFGRSLSGNPDLADDLVQDTMLKAWKSRHQYRPQNSSMRSWAFVILRNSFLSQMRRKKFVGDYDEQKAERMLVTNDEQSHHLHLSDMQRALMELPVDQREALILVGAGGL